MICGVCTTSIVSCSLGWRCWPGAVDPLDIRWEIGLNILLAMGVFGVSVLLLLETERQLGLELPAWKRLLPLPLFSLLVLSVAQWENWVLGWQLMFWMALLAVFGGVYVLARRETGLGRVLLAFVLGVVATFSAGNGILFWIASSVEVRALRNPRRVPRTIAWLTLGFFLFLVYIQGYKPPATHPSTALGLAQPVQLAVYVLKYLGAPLVSFNGAGALCAGGMVLAGFCGLYAWLRRVRGMEAQVLAPYAALAVYAVLGAGMTGVGRLGFGTDQAMSPRYITLSMPIYLAVTVLAYLGWVTRPAGKVPVVRRMVLAVGVGLVVALLGVNSLYGAYRWTERYRFKLPAQAELASGGDNKDLLQRLHPDPAVVIERRAVLQKYGLSVFRR